MQTFNHATDAAQFGSKIGRRFGRVYLRERIDENNTKWHEFALGSVTLAASAAQHANTLPFDEAYAYLQNIPRLSPMNKYDKGNMHGCWRPTPPPPPTD